MPRRTAHRAPRDAPPARAAWIRGALVVLALGLLACDAEEPAPERPRGPHVVLVVLDTVREDRCFREVNGRPVTPHLAALARKGVRFRECWAPCSWTGPSHASLFTGLEPPRHGYLIGNRQYLDASFQTLAETLREAGYRTACYSNNYMVAPHTGLTRGFEIFMPMFQEPATESVSQASRTHTKALRWARSVDARGERFFLFINDFEPHLAYAPQERFQQRFVSKEHSAEEIADAREFDDPLQLGYSLGQVEVCPDKLALLSDLYDAEIATVDDALGELIAGLRDGGLLDEALLIVTSDHGEEIGEHGLIGHQLSLYRTQTHVPLVIRFPGEYEGGRVVDDVVRLTDLMPTCLEICGLPVPGGLDGSTLRRDLPGRISRGTRGYPQSMDRIRRLFPKGDLSRYSKGVRSVFDGRYHCIRYGSGHVEIYDVREDPGETRDLSEVRPDLKARLLAVLAD